MNNASLLVLVSGSTRPADLEPILQSARETHTHLSILVLGSMPRLPVFAYGIETYGLSSVPSDWQDEIEAAQVKLTAATKAIETLLQTAGTSGDVGALNCEPTAVGAIISRRAATRDAVVMAHDLRNIDAVFENALHGALFLSPVGVILNAISAPVSLKPSRVFIAWDTSLPAARAVHAALPLLKEASETSINIFNPVTSPERDGENPGSDVARWLSHHGCRVDLQQYPSGGDEIGTCILRRAAKFGADLIVMGAYGHSRIRQAVFGGTTRTMIEQADMPVMLAH